MFRRVGALTMVGALFALAGCESQVAPSGSASPQSASSITPDSNCGGTHRVRVAPCPVKLTHATRNSGITVTVSVPGIAYANWSGDTGCTDGLNDCYRVRRAGSSESPTQFIVTSASVCGTGYTEFTAWGRAQGSDYLIGTGDLKVVNKYCPGS